MLIGCLFFFFSKQKTAYEMRISDWSSDVCSSDLEALGPLAIEAAPAEGRCRKDRIKIGFERGNGSDRQSIGNDAIALGAELIGPGRLGAAERDEVIHRPLPPVRGAINISFGASYTPLACKPSIVSLSIRM